MEMTFKDWNVEEMTGYHPLTTFYMDFSIADGFGKDAVVDTFNNVFDSWNGDYKFMTELTMVMNWKIWEHYETNPELAKLYSNYWDKMCQWCELNLTGDELAYYYQVTD